MPDFRVTFRGDLGNLGQFDSAIKNSASISAQAFKNANLQIASLSGKIENSQGVGRFVQRTRTTIDSLNNTFRQSGEIVRRYISDYKVETDKLGRATVKPIFDTAYLSSFDKAIGNLAAYEQAVKKTARAEKDLSAARLQHNTTLARAANLENTLTGRRANAQKQLISNPAITQAQILQSQAQATYNQASANLAAVKPGTKGIVQLRKLAADAQKDLNSATQILAAARAPFEQEISRVDRALKRLTNIGPRSAARLGATEAAISRRPSVRNLQAAAEATPPIQTDLAKVLAESQDVQKNLLRRGLGAGTKYGTVDFQRALAAQDAQITKYSENIRTNLTTVSGHFKDLTTGKMKEFTVDLDNQGKVIGRWGGQLSGAGSILRQTVRDFQKVIEWTVATTVVFGTLATVVGQLQNINELNTLLARFSITAQTSATETNAFFNDLKQVAFDTATPLKELVTVADDIALATREAGDSTDEWKGKILDLTRAVGIFTNLTGKDTVAAADQLSSAFKQLDIEPNQLIGVLNKVTAVAGGQSNAIADIVQSVAGLAEAAKAAGFSVDEQIAGVQVLAQVTNKTSAEIATSFKNLFGSVSSVGSEKILKEFGIQVRDAEGGIRDFLDIYRDVANALEKGIIPQSRLPDVLRGLSGGPRRAPDAAALLSNIGRIDEVIVKSQNATNEALIANAKILDTNAAKVIQFQNSIDAAVFQRFGEAVRDLTSALTDMGIFFANVVGSIDPHIVTLAVKLSAVTLSIVTFGKLIKLIGSGLGIGAAVRSLKNLAQGFQQVTIAVSKATAAADKRVGQQIASGLIVPAGTVMNKSQAQASPSVFAKLTSVLGANKGKLALGGLAAAGTAGALASGVDTNTVGTILQMAGAVGLLVPGLNVLGGVAILAGTGLQLLSGNSEEAKVSAAQLSSEVYTLTQSLQETQNTANGYIKTQKDSLKVIDELRDKQNKTADEQARLSDATTTYVTATLGLAQANREVSKTFDDIISKIPNLAAKYQSFKDIVKTGGLSPTDPFLKDLQKQLAQDILRNSGQGIFAGASIPAATAFRGNRGPEDVIARLKGQPALDLTTLIENPNDLLKLFNLRIPGLTPSNPTYGQQRFAIPENDASISLIQSALTQLLEAYREGKSDLTEEEIKALVDAITKLSASGSSLSQNAAALAQLNANIQAKILTGEFRGPQAQNATLATGLASQLQGAAGQFTPPQLRGGTGGQQVNPVLQSYIDLFQQLQEIAEKGGSVTIDQLIKIGTTGLQLSETYSQIAAQGEQALGEGIIQFLQQAGVEQETLDIIAKKYNVTLQETKEINDALAASMDNAIQSAKQNFADRSLQLLIAENSGDFEGNAKGLAILKQQNQEALDSTVALAESIGRLSNDQFVDLNNALSSVIGLQGEFMTQLQLTSLEEGELEERMAGLGEKLIENAVKAGVNAEGIKRIRDEVLKLTAAILAVPTYKKVIVEVVTLYSEGGRTGRGGKDRVSQDKLVNALKQQAEAAKKGTDPAAQINKILKEINKIISGGSGGSLGQLPNTSSSSGGGGGGGSTAYNKPGLLDIPEEIAKASNAQQLLKQAVANARNLQSQIPGETKANKGEIVELLNGTKRVLETRGIGEEYLRRAMDELRDEIKRQNDLLSKADSIRRIRVGAGDFSALANVPINSQSGVSVGGPQGPISISLDINGTVLTPAQFAQWADQIAAALKRQLSA